MLILLAALAAQPNQWFARMNDYVACLERGTPGNMKSLDQQARAAAYRRAAAQCQAQRKAAIDAAVAGREPGTSAAEARALAIDILNTLDPMSSVEPQR